MRSPVGRNDAFKALTDALAAQEQAEVEKQHAEIARSRAETALREAKALVLEARYRLALAMRPNGIDAEELTRKLEAFAKMRDTERAEAIRDLAVPRQP